MVKWLSSNCISNEFIAIFFIGTIGKAKGLSILPKEKFVDLGLMANKRKYRYLLLHKVGGDITRRAFEKRRKNIGNLPPLNQFGHLPRKLKKKRGSAYKADLALRKGIVKFKMDIKRVRFYLKVESNIRKLRRSA